jgi:hypothetical protein
MSAAEVTSSDAVRAAAREFDALGEDAFLYEYGFEPASDCVVLIDGQGYPARALLGAAYGHQFPEIGPLAESDSGLPETMATLRELGFEVQAASDNQRAGR